jgi:hypothetical protein
MLLNYENYDQKKAEYKIKESDTRLSVLFQLNSITIIMSKIPDNTIVDGIDTFAELHGYNKDEILGYE